MDFLSKLDYLMKTHNLNKRSLSINSGIPYTTIDGFYKKGFENTKLSTIKKLCDYFDVSIDYLAIDYIEDPDYGKKEKSPTPVVEDGTSILDSRLSEALRRLTPEQKQRLLDLIESMFQQ